VNQRENNITRQREREKRKKERTRETNGMKRQTFSRAWPSFIQERTGGSSYFFYSSLAYTFSRLKHDRVEGPK